MDNSPLSRLPAELRNRIYELVLVPDEPIILVISEINHIRHVVRRDRRATSSIALLSTCTKINVESQPLFYGSNTFELLTFQEYAAEALEDFLLYTTTRRNLQLLRHVQVNIDKLFISLNCSYTAKAITKILDITRSHRESLPDCCITIAFMYDYYYEEDMLRLELQTASEETMDHSISECMAQIAAASVAIKGMPGSPAMDYHLFRLASEGLIWLESLLSEVLAAFKGDEVAG